MIETSLNQQVCIRSDLWLEMSNAELENQRALMIAQLNSLYTRESMSVSQTAVDLYLALERGLQSLNELIDSRYEDKSGKKPNFGK